VSEITKCKICGRSFEKRSGLSTHLRHKHDLKLKDYYDKYLKKESEGSCKICGKPTKFINFQHGYRDTCCSACTMEMRYGVRNSFQLESVKDKIKQTMLDRYGVENTSQSEEIKQKKIDTFKKNYGVDHNLQRKEMIAKTHSDEIIKKQSESRKKTLKQKYGVENSYLIEDVVRRTYDSTKSKSEQYFEDKLKEFSIDFIAQYKDEKYPYYCDFYLPEYNCYIELNIYWLHQKHWFDSKDNNDLKTIEKIKSKVESSSGETSKFYKRSLEVWTEVDLEKREVARKNNLNYKVFWTQEEIEEFFENFSTEKLKNNRDYE